MVMGRTGAREKAGIADIETLDIDTFVNLLNGQHTKWLWYGKPRKNHEIDAFSSLGGDNGIVFTKDENGGYIWTSQKRDSTADDVRVHGMTNRIYSHPMHESSASIDSPEKEQALRRKAMKTVTGRVTDARSGLGRIKDAVGMNNFRGHHSKYSKEDNFVSDSESFRERPPRRTEGQAKANEEHINSSKSQTNLAYPPDRALQQSMSMQQLDSPLQQDRASRQPSLERMKGRTNDSEAASTVGSSSLNQDVGSERRPSPPLKTPDDLLALDLDAGLTRRASRQSEAHSRKKSGQNSEMPVPLQRTRSLPRPVAHLQADKNGSNHWPRHMSFSNFIDVLANDRIGNLPTASFGEIDESKPPHKLLSWEQGLTFDVQQMAHDLQQIRINDVPLVERKLDNVTTLDKQTEREHEMLEELYEAKLEEHNNLKDASDDLLTEERNRLTESVRDVETLGAKLEYELNTLQSKVEDMENGIADFERQIEQLESRTAQLDNEKRTSWLQWALALFAWSGEASTER